MSAGEIHINPDVALLIEVIRTDRKRSVCIQIDGQKVRLRVPHTLSEKHIRELVVQRSAWIRQKLALQAQIRPVRPKEYVNGERFAYLGRHYRLERVAGDRGGVKLHQGRLQVTVSTGLADAAAARFIRAQLQTWYKTHALARLTEKTERYAAILGVEPRSVRIKSYRARWGSCSLTGEITYNWCIVIAPHRIVDYVVVHELCHILQHNHSPGYWRAVERVFPDYRQCRAWLRLNGNRLVV